MSDPTPPGEIPRVKARLPFKAKPFAGGRQQALVFLYGIVTAGLIGMALYMAMVAGHPLTSSYVAAPAIGAMWFGLRLFMTLGLRK